MPRANPIQVSLYLDSELDKQELSDVAACLGYFTKANAWLNIGNMSRLVSAIAAASRKHGPEKIAAALRPLLED